MSPQDSPIPEQTLSRPTIRRIAGKRTPMSDASRPTMISMPARPEPNDAAVVDVLAVIRRHREQDGYRIGSVGSRRGSGSSRQPFQDKAFRDSNRESGFIRRRRAAHRGFPPGAAAVILAPAGGPCATTRSDPAQPCANLGSPQRRNSFRRLPSWLKPGQQASCRGGDFGDCRLERLDVDTRRSCHAADLAHVLAGGRLNLFVGGGRFQAAQFGDVSAHDLHDRTPDPVQG